jgi:hypothetical protein
MPKTEIAIRKPVVLAARKHRAGTRTQMAGPAVTVREPGRFRRLKWNELVCLGDFVADGRRGFKLWEGPSGFRANSFVKPIYRPDEGRSASPAIHRD